MAHITDEDFLRELNALQEACAKDPARLEAFKQALQALDAPTAEPTKKHLDVIDRIFLRLDKLERRMAEIESGRRRRPPD